RADRQLVAGLRHLQPVDDHLALVTSAPRCDGPSAAPRPQRENSGASAGTPAIAAMSLRFAAIALRPARRGPTAATTKSVPSVSTSVVTSTGWAGGARTAQRSPGPR